MPTIAMATINSAIQGDVKSEDHYLCCSWIKKVWNRGIFDEDGH